MVGPELDDVDDMKMVKRKEIERRRWRDAGSGAPYLSSVPTTHPRRSHSLLPPPSMSPHIEPKFPDNQFPAHHQ